MSKFAKLVEQKFIQELHTSCMDQSKDASFKLTVTSNGVADYLVINAYEIAFSDHEEIDAFAKLLHIFMDENCENEYVQKD